MSAKTAEDYQVGCILLQQPFFFDRTDWIPVPSWAKSIVRGKGFSTDQPDGAQLWGRVQQILLASHAQAAEPLSESEEGRFGDPTIILPRLGQGAFRVIVTDGYDRQCALTRSHVLHVLEAAHIKPYSLGGTHQPTNGMLLRQDVHTLFDRGYLSVTPEYRVEVSKRIKEEFDNGKEYYALHGGQIHLPEPTYLRPSQEYLTSHDQTVFRP